LQNLALMYSNSSGRALITISVIFGYVFMVDCISRGGGWKRQYAAQNFNSCPDFHIFLLWVWAHTLKKDHFDFKYPFSYSFITFSIKSAKRADLWKLSIKKLVRVS
jgi:hypothetical protein